jgi:hypothetical protein
VPLGPHASGPEDAETGRGRGVDGLGEERRLADARVAAHEEDATIAGCRGDEAADHGELRVTPDQRLLGHHRAILTLRLREEVGRLHEIRRREPLGERLVDGA